MKLIGLTGGIACGKSTVAAQLRSLGVPVIDADQVSRAVVSPGTAGLQAVVARFGPDILQPDGELNREALGELVMRDPAAKADLEAITHPRIRTAVAEAVGAHAAQGATHVFVEAALLVETGSHVIYDGLWVVRCEPALQRARLMARRGFDPETAARWISNQMSLDEKASHATEVIENSGDLDALSVQVIAAWGRVKAQPQDPG